MPRAAPKHTLAALALAGTMLAGCGSSQSSSSQSAQGTQTSAAAASGGAVVHVVIKNYAYSPAQVTVKPGTKLVFINRDGTAHTATSTSPPLDTGSIQPGGQATVTVRAPGTYHYICQFHPFMHGTIRVS